MSAGDLGPTRPTRLYEVDIELLERQARLETVKRDRTVKPAEIVHEQLAQLRLDERAAEREREQ